MMLLVTVGVTGGDDDGDDDGDVNEGDDDMVFLLTHMTHNVPGMATLNDNGCDDVNTPTKLFLTFALHTNWLEE